MWGKPRFAVEAPWIACGLGASSCACPLNLAWWPLCFACRPLGPSNHAGVCGYSWLTSFKVDNLCTASSSTTSGYGCWLPLHNADAQLLPGPTNPDGVAVTLVGENVYASFYALDVAPTTQIGKTSIEVHARENGCCGQSALPDTPPTRLQAPQPSCGLLPP